MIHTWTVPLSHGSYFPTLPWKSHNQRPRWYANTLRVKLALVGEIDLRAKKAIPSFLTPLALFSRPTTAREQRRHASPRNIRDGRCRVVDAHLIERTQLEPNRLAAAGLENTCAREIGRVGRLRWGAYLPRRAGVKLRGKAAAASWPTASRRC